MTKRYYYTDPLKALMAMRDWGVECYILCNDKDGYLYNARKGDKVDFAEAYLGLNYFSELNSLNKLGKIYIAKESEHIFEPQSGDISNKGYHYSKRANEWRFVYIFGCGDTYFSANQKTFLRDDKPFPWYDGVEEVQND